MPLIASIGFSEVTGGPIMGGREPIMWGGWGIVMGPAGGKGDLFHQLGIIKPGVKKEVGDEKDAAHPLHMAGSR